MQAGRIIYLDHAATTPIDPAVVDVMLRFMGPDAAYGNPASDHAYGAAASDAVQQARQQVAALVGADPPEIVWTSGATESINLALKGACRFHRQRGRHVISVRTEHHATLDSCRSLARDGFDVTLLTPDRAGVLDPSAIASALRPDTVLVSVMHVNNEIGVIQDIAAMGEICRAHGVLFHVDAVQSLGRLPIDLTALPVDLMSLSGHKIYGPKGIGALFVRRQPRRARIAPLLHGGGQERGLRAGTLATHQIVGMGEACRLLAQRRTAEHERIAALGEALWSGLRELPGVHLNGHVQRRAGGILNVSFDGVDGEALMAELTRPLDDGDTVLAVSSGSACTSASPEPSYVLRALGRSDALAAASVRFSPGRHTTRADIDIAVGRVRTAVERLRALAPAPVAIDREPEHDAL